MSMIVGITGKARAGKDTFAKGMADMGYFKASLADPLKVVTAYIANEMVDLYYGDKTKEEHCEALGMTRRLALQRMGTEGVRNALGKDVWVNRLINDWRRRHCPPTVVPDVRFDNEADLIIASGGIVLEIVRPDNANLSGDSATHVSESGINRTFISATIKNKGSMDDLVQEAHQFVALLHHQAKAEQRG